MSSSRARRQQGGFFAYAGSPGDVAACLLEACSLTGSERERFAERLAYGLERLTAGDAERVTVSTHGLTVLPLPGGMVLLTRLKQRRERGGAR